MCLLELQYFSKDFLVSICYENELFLPLIQILINKDVDPDYLTCLDLFFKKFKEAKQRLRPLEALIKSQKENVIKDDKNECKEQEKLKLEVLEQYNSAKQEKNEFWNLMLGVVNQAITPEIYLDFSHLMPKELINLRKDILSQLFVWLFNKPILEELLIENSQEMFSSIEEIFSQENSYILNEEILSKIDNKGSKTVFLTASFLLEKIQELKTQIVEELSTSSDQNSFIVESIDFNYYVFYLVVALKESVTLRTERILTAFRKLVFYKKLFKRNKKKLNYLLYDIFKSYKKKLTMQDYREIIAAIPKK